MSKTVKRHPSQGILNSTSFFAPLRILVRLSGRSPSLVTTSPSSTSPVGQLYGDLDPLLLPATPPSLSSHAVRLIWTCRILNTAFPHVADSRSLPVLILLRVNICISFRFPFQLSHHPPPFRLGWTLTSFHSPLNKLKTSTTFSCPSLRSCNWFFYFSSLPLTRTLPALLCGAQNSRFIVRYINTFCPQPRHRAKTASSGTLHLNRGSSC